MLASLHTCAFFSSSSVRPAARKSMNGAGLCARTMKDWQRSPEPPSMMGPPATAHPTGSMPSSPTSGEATVPLATMHASPFSLSEHAPYVKARTKVDTSLSEMVKKVILQRIHLFDTFGTTPFPIVRPILEQCSAKKLWALEQESPHLISHTGYIWKRLCIREYRDIASGLQSGLLAEADDWRALYELRQSQQQEAIEAAAARVKERYASLEANREASRVRVVAETPAMRAKQARGQGTGGSSSSGSLTAGQKLLSKARRQGNVRLQMTTGIRKAGATQTPPTDKRPRVEQLPGAAAAAPTRSADGAPRTCSHAERGASTSSVATLPPQRQTSSIFITKRRIASGGLSGNHR